MLIVVFLAACSSFSSPTPTGNIQVLIQIDGQQSSIQVPAGTTAQGVLEKAGISLNPLDRMDPPSYTIVENNATILVTRVREVFYLQEKVIPFERQTVRNESLPEGQTMLVQTGVNGVQQITYRQVLEDEQEVSNTVFKSEIITEPLPEIVMVGVQKPFAPITIPGRLAYLAGGNAWVMDGSTGSRLPVVTTGDLDGYIFSLSPRGDWLLFSRKEKASGDEGSGPANINSLWAINLVEKSARPINLNIYNVIHYAEWVPGQGLTILYSTVEPRTIAPGWQANNDLQRLTFAPSGAIVRNEEIIEANAGGIYGWWGSAFLLSPDGEMMAYARPDGIGLVDLEQKVMNPLTEILPLQTGRDWAWVSGLGWAPDHSVLYFVSHVPKPGLESQESSPLFDLAALPLYNAKDDTDQAGFVPGPVISIVPQAGMFAYPVPSPLLSTGGYKVAYLQAIFPEQSDTRRYRLVVMDRDGSNRQVIFPPQDYQGLSVEKSQLIWSPIQFSNGSLWLAVNYQGNLWLVDSDQGQAQQVTGDGLINRLDWRLSSRED